jgi:hypothetical protein
MHLRMGRRRSLAATDTAMRQLYASYKETIGQRADRVLRDALPDDEWLAAIKAEADYRLLRELPSADDDDSTVTFRAVTWEVIEPSLV